MISNTRKKLAVVTVVVTIIVVAVISTWVWSQLSPFERMYSITRIKSFIAQGTVQGGMFALLALGFTLIYGVAGLVNMSHGAFYMLGVYVFFASFTSLEYSPFEHSAAILVVAFILALAVVAIAGTTVYRVGIQPVIGDDLASMVVTVGILIAIQQLMLIIFGTAYRPVYPFLPGSINILGATLTYAQVLAFAVSLVLFFCLWVSITKSKLGGAMRAVSQDRETAMLMGINTDRLYMLTMAISTALAAAAGILITSSTTRTANPYIWSHPLALSFGIVILGGLGSIKGSLIGAFIFGYSENFVVSMLPEGSYLKGAVALMVMVLVLLFRPRGLFGKRAELEE